MNPLMYCLYTSRQLVYTYTDRFQRMACLDRKLQFSWCGRNRLLVWSNVYISDTVPWWLLWILNTILYANLRPCIVVKWMSTHQYYFPLAQLKVGRFQILCWFEPSPNVACFFGLIVPKYFNIFSTQMHKFQYHCNRKSSLYW